ncbi:MAG: M3 family metallopeptidase [candidate division Zixibacteria bacterium]|nr:M3 family metallopeptidase [candidate division Zixibacteria bacterium]
MRRKVILLVCLASLFLAGTSCREQPDSSGDVPALLDSLEHKLAWLDYRLGLEEWNLQTSGRADSLEFYRDLYCYVVSDAGAFNTLRHAGSRITDDVDRRRWQIAYGRLALGRIEGESAISGLRDSLAAVAGNFRPEFEGAPSDAALVRQTYRTDQNTTRRELAYRAWVSVGFEVANGLERLMRLRNHEARKYGYNNFLAMVFNRLDLKSSDYLALLRQLDASTERPYREIIDSLKRALNMDYIEIWDVPFAFSNIDRQVDAYFPADSQLPFIQRSLAAIGFDLDKLPVYLDLQTGLDRQELTRAFLIKAPYDARIAADLAGGHDRTAALMRQIGRAIGFIHIKQEQPFFNIHVDDCWSEATGDLIASLTADRAWLEEYAGIPTALLSKYLEARKQQDIIDLRTLLLRLHFEYEAYTNPNRDLNRLYWDLFERYLLLPRHDDLQPWAALAAYVTQPVYLQNYLYADMVVAQTLSFLEKNYGRVTDNPTTGSFLVQNYLRFGGRYDWRELVRRGTDEELNPQYLTQRLGI